MLRITIQVYSLLLFVESQNAWYTGATAPLLCTLALTGHQVDCSKELLRGGMHSSCKVNLRALHVDEQQRHQTETALATQEQVCHH
jgi:hypothetical protein